jgi:hypothetical protein
MLAASIIKTMSSKHLWNVGKLLPDYTAQHPEDSHFHIRRRENLKSHQLKLLIITNLLSILWDNRLDPPDSEQQKSFCG